MEVDDNTLIPRRSDAGLRAQDIFFESFNEINFYFEDEDQENLYFSIFKRILPDVRIARIFGLRGKPNVIKHALDPANVASAQKSIYVVDKDFDDLLQSVVTKENVFYLDRYCIENYLLEESAAIEVIIETLPKNRRPELLRSLKFDDYCTQIVRDLRPLFEAFYFAQRFDLDLQNTSSKPEEFTLPNYPWRISEKKVSDYVNKVTSNCVNKKIFDTEESAKKSLSEVFLEQKFEDANISGKYLMCLSLHYIKSLYKLTNLTVDSYRYRLAKNGSLLKLQTLADGVRSYLGKSALKLE